jgi:DNA-binding IclR family transcriptional regulator
MRRLGAEALRRMDGVGLASEYLADLRDRTKHAVALLAWDENGPVAMRWEYGAYPLPITVGVGSTLPVLTTSAGQVFLTYLPDALAEPVVQAARAAHPTGRSDAEISRFKTDVRRQGVCCHHGCDDPRRYSGGRSGLRDRGVAAIGGGDRPAALPRAPAVVAEMSTELLATTKAISAELGYLPLA